MEMRMGGGKDQDGWLDEHSVDIGGGTRALASTGSSSNGSLSEVPQDEDTQIVTFKNIEFYVSSFSRDVAGVILGICTFGIAFLVATWYPRLYPKICFWKLVKQADEAADHVVVTSSDDVVSIIDINIYDPQKNELVSVKQRRQRGKVPMNAPRMFLWREERFWFNSRDGHWTRRAFHVGPTYGALHQIGAESALQDSTQGGGALSSSTRRRLTYGPNILKVRVPKFGRLLMAEIFKPFFIFQVMSITAWCFLDYATYACIIVVLTVFAVFYAAYETWSNLISLKRLAASETPVRKIQILRETTKGQTSVTLASGIVSSAELMPGDLVAVDRGMVVPCDLVLLAGQCIVNEAMLTGESAPVLKSQLPPDSSAQAPMYQLTSERDAKFRLLSGSQIVQTKRSRAPPLPLPEYRPESDQSLLSIWQIAPYAPDGALPVVAVVVGTAYATAKGQLIRAILFPKPSKYDFERKLYYFVANLVVFLVVGCTLIVAWQAKKRSAVQIITEIINLITITVPPQLPLALSISLSISFTRLQKRGVQCISPARILAAGRVNLTAFDKTGTLTQDGLSLRGVCPMACHGTAVSVGPLEDSTSKLFSQAVQALKADSSSPLVQQTAQSQLSLFQALAACHSISALHDEDEGSPGDVTHVDLPGGDEESWFVRLMKPRRSTAYHKQGKQNGGYESETESVSDSPLGRFVGDPLELEAFSSTGWQYLSRPDVPGGNSSPSSDPIWGHPHMEPSVDVVVAPPPQQSKSVPALGIVRRFDFDSDLRMMSTVVVELTPGATPGQPKKFWLLTKGAPESLYEKCVTESVAPNFDEQLQDLALNGDRVLACAFRPLSEMPMDQILGASRGEMEHDLILSGLLVMENRLKEESTGFLDELTRAGIRSVMVTGDNPLTAISVARKCGPFFLRPDWPTFLVDAGGTSAEEEGEMGTGCTLRDLQTQREYSLDSVLSSSGPGDDDVEAGAGPASQAQPPPRRQISLAVTGRAFDALVSQHQTLKLVGEAVYGATATPRGGVGSASPLELVLGQAGVFARMTPGSKLELMYRLQDLGYTVCMTGDGANDSSALKAADVGISIASSLQEDSSVAAAPSIAAPFSTLTPHIGVVPQVLSEGRSALVNATTMFKYMYFYALIQTTAVVVLYDHDEDLSQYEYLYGDLFVVFVLILALPGLRPSHQLSRGRPEGNLLALPILASVYGQSILLVGFQLLAYWLLQQQTWYFWDQAAAESATGTYSYTQDTTTMFLISSFQYTTIAMALSQSFGIFRAPPWTNIPLCIAFAVQLIASTVLILCPPAWALSLFNMVDLGAYSNFLFSLWMLAIANGILFILYERYAIRHVADEPDAVDPTDLPLLSASQMKKPETRKHVLRRSKQSTPRYFEVQMVGRPLWSALSQRSEPLQV